MESYTPVAYVHREVIEEEISKATSGTVNYFSGKGTVESESGKILKLEETGAEGWFIFLDNGATIRIDRIITLFGKPGAAFDEYDAFANACLDCKGGYDFPDD